MKTKALTMWLSLAVLVFTGCGPTQAVVLRDVMEAKSEGISKNYPISSEKAWDIAAVVFLQEGVDAKMILSNEVFLFSQGAAMGVWTKSIDENNTQVAVVKKRGSVYGTTKLTEMTFHERFAQIVADVKAGKQLPGGPPKYGD